MPGSESDAAHPAHLPDPLRIPFPAQDLSKDPFLATLPRDAEGRPMIGGIPILRRIGAGAMGAVYYAIHPRLNIEVAIKVLPFHLAQMEVRTIARFTAEARLAAQLESEHVVRVLDVNVEGDTHYIIMQFVRGESAGTLMRRMREQGKRGLAEENALRVVRAATKGLAAAHERGITHRDVKPDNILIPGQNLDKSKLADLGLAKPEGEKGSLGTGTAATMGTPGYMAPEQAENARTAGAPADVFGMGATLYALITGGAPFSGVSMAVVLRDTALKDPEPLPKEISALTRAIVTRCLAKKPGRRFANGGELLAALEGRMPVELQEEPAAPAEPFRHAPLPLAVVPLSGDVTRLAIDWMRQFTGLVRARRLFPQWASAADTPRQILMISTRGLLTQVPAVTFSIDARGLTINNRPVGGTPIAMDFERLIRTRAIEALTLAAGLEPEEIDSFVSDLSAPRDPSPAANRWQLFLSAAQIRHLDVRQGFLPPSPSGLFTATERPLEIDELDQLWITLRQLKSAVEKLRQYPPTDNDVTSAMARATTAFSSILSRVERITLSPHDGILHVNHVPARARAAADAVELVTSTLQRRGHRRLTLLQNITPDEVQALVSFFSVDDADVGRGILAASEASHVLIDLEDVDTTILPDDPDSVSFPSGTAETELLPLDAAPGDRPDAIDVRASFWLQAPIDQFLSPMAEREFAPTLDALASMPKSATRLLDRLGVYLADSDRQWRGRALTVLTVAIETSKAGRAMLLIRARAALKAVIEDETDATLYPAVAQAVRAWIAGALAAWPIATAAEFLARDLRPILDRDNRRDLKAMISQRLRTLTEGTALDPAYNALLTGPSPLRESAAQILAAVGPPVVPRLVELICASEDLDIRKSAAGALRVVGGTGQAELAKLVKLGTPPEKLQRILTVLDIAGREGLATPVFAAINHPERPVRDAAFALIKRVERPIAVAILRRTLAMDVPEIRLTSLAVAAELSLADLLVDIIKLAELAVDDAQAQACCTFLAVCSAPQAVPALRRIFEMRRTLLRKGFGEAPRAAAITAAAKINHPEAKALVEAAKADKSEAVRNAAK